MSTLTAVQQLRQESFWENRSACNEAEKKMATGQQGGQGGGRQGGGGGGRGRQRQASQSKGGSNLASEIAKARQHIKNSLETVDGLAALAGTAPDVAKQVKKLEADNKALKKTTDDLKKLVEGLEKRVAELEKGGGGSSSSAASAAKSSSSAPAAKDDDDDEEEEDVDLFGSESEEEDEEKVRVREERLKAYAEKKAKKPGPIAKTSVLLDVKPWDDETDMDAMLKACKSIEKDGLVWGASKLVPVGYGINKLQVMCVVEDEKVSIDELMEQIQEFEDFVQSVDISSMSKI